MGNAKEIPCSPIQVSGNTEPSEAASLTGEKWQIPLPGFHVILHTKEAFFKNPNPKGMERYLSICNITKIKFWGKQDSLF